MTENEDGVKFIVSEELVQSEVITEKPTTVVTASPTATQEFDDASLANSLPSFLPEGVQVPEAIGRGVMCGVTEWPEQQEGYFRSCENEGQEGERILYGVTTTIETAVNVTSTETETVLTTISPLGATESTPADDEDQSTLNEITDLDDGLDSGETELLSEEERVLTVTSTAVEDAVHQKDQEGEEDAGDGSLRRAYPCRLHLLYPVMLVSVWFAG